MKNTKMSTVTMAELLAEAQAPFMPKGGAIFHATVARVDSRTGVAWLEFGGKTEALLDPSEIGDEELEVGHEVTVIAIEEPRDGEPFHVSLKQAQPWIAMLALKDEGKIATAQILPPSGNRRPLKGVLASVEGAVGFIPLFKLGMKPQEAIDRREIPVKVAQADPVENKLIFDHMTARRALSADNREKRFAELKLGMEVSGRIVKREAYGVFVDIGGAVSDLWGLLPNAACGNSQPEEGEMVTAVISRLDRDRKGNPSVRLTTRAAQSSHEQTRNQRFDELSEGDVIDGTVHHGVEYGYFIDVGGDLQGLLHLSQHTGETLEDGQPVKVRIKKKERTPDGKRHLSLATANEARGSFIDRVRPGQILSGVITNVKHYGAFVLLDRATRLSGLVHISALPGNSTQLAELTTGMRVKVKVLDVDRTARRIDLSLMDAPSAAA